MMSEEKLRDILRWSIDNGRLSYINELIGAQFAFLWIQPVDIDAALYDRNLFGNLDHRGCSNCFSKSGEVWIYGLSEI